MNTQQVVVADPKPALTTGSRPSAIVPTDMDSCYRLAKAVVLAGMAPKGMETPEKCMIAIMRGMEVGLTPFMALDKIAIINGRPTIWGDGAMGLVRGSGLCEFVRETIEGKDDARVAVCVAHRRGEKEPIRRTFSIADAKKAGLWGKPGPWQQYPERMLQMRARAFALRDGFADVLGGLYLREELEEDRPVRDVTPRDEPPPPPAIAARTGAQQQPAPSPPPEPQTAPAATPGAPAPDPKTDPDAFAKFALGKIREATSGPALEGFWDAYVAPVEAALFPPDMDELLSAYRKREHELN